MSEPTTMQWVVYDMQRRSPIAWHFTEAQAFADAKERNGTAWEKSRLASCFVPMSRAVLLRISQVGNQ